MKIKRLLFTVMVVITAGAAGMNAQGQGYGQGAMQGDTEKLTAYKIAFFTKNLDLTPGEAEKFWPLYNDYSSRKSKLQADRLSLMRYTARNQPNMSESEISSAADKLMQSFSDESELVVTFNESMKKVLPPAKIIRLYHVENQYKQQLLRELNQRRQGSGQQGMRGRSQAGNQGLEQ